jgi:hypothetical protein
MWPARKRSIFGIVATKFFATPANIMADDRFKLVRLVADPGIVGYRDPALSADNGEPLFVGSSGLKVIAMAFDVQTRRGKSVRKPVAKISIRKEDNGQAARS